MTSKAKRNKITSYVKRKLHQPDRYLLLVLGLLLIGGLVMLSSATSAIAYNQFGDSLYYLKHQLVALGIGLVCFGIVYKIDYRVWKKNGLYFLIFSILALTLVFIPGLQAQYGSANSWINIYGFSFQPAELVKLFFLIYFASWIAVKKGKFNNMREGWGPLVLVIGLISFLMLKQPDLGTLSIILASVFMVMLASKVVKPKIIISSILVVAAMAILFMNFKGYQMDRIKCFQNPKVNQQSSCYQINQSLIAVGSGGLWGKGFGESKQKFMYLPEISADSIFSIIAEEMGFIFTLLFVFLYFVLFYRGYVIAKKAPDDFGQLLAIGIVSWISIQAILNIGGMIRLIPMTGVPLPFVSYGGSALLSALIAVGILANISKHTVEE